MRQLDTGKPLLVLAATLLAWPAAAAPVGFEILTPHRAVYDLVLHEASQRSGIQRMTGRIVYELTGNACEGVAVRYRFVTDITTGRETYRTDQQTSTFETPDGRQFDFMTRTYVDEVPENVVRGTAVRSGSKLDVQLSAPVDREVDLPDAVFISTHLVSLIESALAGDRFAHHVIFDGTEDADAVVTSFSVIGAPDRYPTVLDGESAEAVGKIGDVEAWPVTISYFDKKPDATAERLPIYEASFLLYPNGISRRLLMRYDDYALTGQLVSLEMLEPTACEP